MYVCIFIILQNSSNNSYYDLTIASFMDVSACTEGELACGNGFCINKELWCDGKADCEDGTDETEKCRKLELINLSLTYGLIS